MTVEVLQVVQAAAPGRQNESALIMALPIVDLELDELKDWKLIRNGRDRLFAVKFTDCIFRFIRQACPVVQAQLSRMAMLSDCIPIRSVS